MHCVDCMQSRAHFDSDQNRNLLFWNHTCWCADVNAAWYSQGSRPALMSLECFWSWWNQQGRIAGKSLSEFAAWISELDCTCTSADLHISNSWIWQASVLSMVEGHWESVDTCEKAELEANQCLWFHSTVLIYFQEPVLLIFHQTVDSLIKHVSILSSFKRHMTNPNIVPDFRFWSWINL